MLYQMVMLPMIHNPQNHPNFCIFVAFHTFVVGQRRDFNFGSLHRSAVPSPSIWTTKRP